jgi:hypothetical protein
LHLNTGNNGTYTCIACALTRLKGLRVIVLKIKLFLKKLFHDLVKMRKTDSEKKKNSCRN